MRISDWSSDVCSSDLLHQTAALQQQILSSGIGGLGRSDVDRSVRAQCTRRCELIGLSVRVHQLRKQRHVVVQRQVAEGAEAQSPDRIDGVEIAVGVEVRSEEHTSELQSLMSNSYAV